MIYVFLSSAPPPRIIITLTVGYVGSLSLFATDVMVLDVCHP